MAKRSPSRIAVQAAPRLSGKKAHAYVPAFITDDFGRQSRLTVDTATPFVAKKLDAASRRLQMRKEDKLRRDQHRDYVLAEQGLRIEFREAEQARRKYCRLIGTKVRPEKMRHQPPTKRRREWPYASRALPKYGNPVLDRKGERGVFVRIRYYSRKTATAGVSSRVIKYIFHGAELDEACRPYFLSNVGRDVDEAHCAFDHLEQVNWSAQKNAKLLMHAIMAADYRQTPDDMMRTGVIWAEETLGRFGLPYVVTLHAPPEEGDERNWHLHILFSFRPLARVADHEWEVGEMLRTDLDNPQAMRLMREMYASVMTITSFQSGINQPYTAKSNAARGLVHEPQEHLGGVQTSMARDGLFITNNEENFERMMRSEAAQLDEELRHVGEALAQEQALAQKITRHFARVPPLPSQVPQRIMATALTNPLPAIVIPARPWSTPTISLPIELPVRADAVPMLRPVRSIVSAVKAAPSTSLQVELPALPSKPMTVQTVKIANLRLPLQHAPPAVSFPESFMPIVRPQGRIPASIRVSTAPPRMARPWREMPSALPPRLSISVGKAKPLPIIGPIPRMAPTLPQIPAIPVRPDRVVPLNAINIIQHARRVMNSRELNLAIERVDTVLHRPVPRKDGQSAAEKARPSSVTLANEQERRQQALDRLLAQIIAEGRTVDRRHGKRRVEPELLAHHGLVPDDVATNEVQVRLDKIAQDRATELARLAGVRQETAASSDATSPPQVGREVDASRRQSVAGLLSAAYRRDRGM